MTDFKAANLSQNDVAERSRPALTRRVDTKIRSRFCQFWAKYVTELFQTRPTLSPIPIH